MHRRRSTSHSILLIPFVGLWSCFVFGLNIHAGRTIHDQTRAIHHPVAPGVIRSSEVAAESNGEGGTTYRPRIEYTYSINGRDHSSKQVRYGTFASSNQGDSKRVVERFAAGASVEVRYDPDDPTDAVLMAGASGMDLMLTVFLVPFNLIMLGLWAGCLSMLHHAILKPKAGGVPIRQTPQTTTLHLPRASPFMVASIWAIVASFVSVFVSGVTIGFDPPLWVIGAIWVIVLVPAGALYTRERLHLGSGATDLVIDHSNRVIALPRTFGRPTETLIPLERVRDVTIDEVVHTTSKGVTTASYGSSLLWTDAGGRTRKDQLIDGWSPRRAESCASWVAHAIYSPGM